MKALIVAITLAASTTAFAGGHSQAPTSTAAIAGAHSVAEAKANAAALAGSSSFSMGGASSAMGGSGSSDNNVQIGGSRAFAIGAASVPPSAECADHISVLFGAVVAPVKNKGCDLKSLAAMYYAIGDEKKAHAVLDYYIETEYKGMKR